MHYHVERHISSTSAFDQFFDRFMSDSKEKLYIVYFKSLDESSAFTDQTLRGWRMLVLVNSIRPNLSLSKTAKESTKQQRIKTEADLCTTHVKTIVEQIS